MTEKQIQAIGFKLDHHYEHDEWETLRYKKGVLIVEFTFQLGMKILESVDVTIDEVVGQEMLFYELYTIDKILNKQ